MDQTDEPLPDGETGGNRLDLYLHPGEDLLISSDQVGIKKFIFTACLTSRRLFLIDQNETRAGVTAKEIPNEYIVERYLDLSPGSDPVLVLSVRTSDDDLRTMKLRFIQAGKDRTPEIEEWMVVFREGKSTRDSTSRAVPAVTETTGRPAAPTMVWPADPAESMSSRQETMSPAFRQESVPSPGTAVRQERPFSEEIPEHQTPPIPERQGKPAPVPRSIPAPAYIPSPAADRGTGTDEVLYCYHCGKKIPRMANFCPFCGTPTHNPGKSAHNTPSPRTANEVQQAPVRDKPPKSSFWKRLRGKK
jgi:hypothetical protein